jgi:hypothetical protein
MSAQKGRPYDVAYCSVSTFSHPIEFRRVGWTWLVFNPGLRKVTRELIRNVLATVVRSQGEYFVHTTFFEESTEDFKACKGITF